MCSSAYFINKPIARKLESIYVYVAVPMIPQGGRRTWNRASL